MQGRVGLQVGLGSRVLNRDLTDPLESEEMAGIPGDYHVVTDLESRVSAVRHGLRKAQTMATDPRVQHVQKTA